MSTGEFCAMLERTVAYMQTAHHRPGEVPDLFAPHGKIFLQIVWRCVVFSMTDISLFDTEHVVRCVRVGFTCWHALVSTANLIVLSQMD